MSIFKIAVSRVEDNNEINNAKWSDWDDAYHILETYDLHQDSSATTAVEITFLNALIRDNGENLRIYLDAIECIEYGFSFAK